MWVPIKIKVVEMISWDLLGWTNTYIVIFFYLITLVYFLVLYNSIQNLIKDCCNNFPFLTVHTILLSSLLLDVGSHSESTSSLLFHVYTVVVFYVQGLFFLFLLYLLLLYSVLVFKFHYILYVETSNENTGDTNISDSDSISGDGSNPTPQKDPPPILKMEDNGNSWNLTPKQWKDLEWYAKFIGGAIAFGVTIVVLAKYGPVIYKDLLDFFNPRRPPGDSGGGLKSPQTLHGDSGNGGAGLKSPETFHGDPNNYLVGPNAEEDMLKFMEASMAVDKQWLVKTGLQNFVAPLTLAPLDVGTDINDFWVEPREIKSPADAALALQELIRVAAVAKTAAVDAAAEFEKVRLEVDHATLQNLNEIVSRTRNGLVTNVSSSLASLVTTAHTVCGVTAARASWAAECVRYGLLALAVIEEAKTVEEQREALVQFGWLLHKVESREARLAQYDDFITPLLENHSRQCQESLQALLTDPLKYGIDAELQKSMDSQSYLRKFIRATEVAENARALREREREKRGVH